MNWLLTHALASVVAPPIFSLALYFLRRNLDTWILAVLPASLIGVLIFFSVESWVACGTNFETNDIKCPGLRDLFAMMLASTAIVLGSGLAALIVAAMKKFDHMK
jgi:hypothetical protein